MEKRYAFWVELKNNTRSMLVASGDWESIIGHHFHLVSFSHDRWSESDGTWFWRAEEARDLSDALESDDSRACHGLLMVDLDFGPGVRGTDCEFIQDGLTPDQRTSDLIQFLREGSFRWKFVTRPCQEEEGGPAG